MGPIDLDRQAREVDAPLMRARSPLSGTVFAILLKNISGPRVSQCWLTLTYRIEEQMYAVEDSMTLIQRSSSTDTRESAGVSVGRIGVNIYMAGYMPRTMRYAFRAPMLSRNNGIRVAWKTRPTAACDKRMNPIFCSL